MNFDPALTPEVDLPLILAGLIMLSVLGGSTVLWIFHIQKKPPPIIPRVDISAWPIGWVNFLLYLVLLFIGVVCTQYFAFLFFKDSLGPEVDELTPRMAVLAVLTLQLPLLAGFYLARRFWPEVFAGRLNETSLSIVAAIRITAPLFIRYLPVIWIASFAWSGFLSLLQKFDLIEEFPPQELVTLLTKGGEPLLIGILIICAVLLAPLVEELIFRGCIYRFFKSKASLLTSQLISAALFSMMHFNLMSFAPLIVVGLLLSIVYERTGNILIPICFHAFFNAFSLLMVFIMSQSDALPV